MSLHFKTLFRFVIVSNVRMLISKHCNQSEDDWKAVLHITSAAFPAVVTSYLAFTTLTWKVTCSTDAIRSGLYTISFSTRWNKCLIDPVSYKIQFLHLSDSGISGFSECELSFKNLLYIILPKNISFYYITKWKFEVSVSKYYTGKWKNQAQKTKHEYRWQGKLRWLFSA